MFFKPFQIVHYPRNISLIIKRNYNFKKLSIQIEKNPHMKNLLEEQSKKNESQGVLKKLVNKR
jgi:hypothetical protein